MSCALFVEGINLMKFFWFQKLQWILLYLCIIQSSWYKNLWTALWNYWNISSEWLSVLSLKVNYSPKFTACSGKCERSNYKAYFLMWLDKVIIMDGLFFLQGLDNYLLNDMLSIGLRWKNSVWFIKHMWQKCMFWGNSLSLKKCLEKWGKKEMPR